MNQFFQRLLGTFETQTDTPSQAQQDAQQVPRTLNPQEVRAVAGGPQIRNDSN